LSEELGSAVLDGRHDERTVQKLVSLFTRSFGNKEATVTCSAQQGRVIMLPGVMVSTDGVV
jgi:hypothetical protein